MLPFLSFIYSHFQKKKLFYRVFMVQNLLVKAVVKLRNVEPITTTNFEKHHTFRV